MHGLAENDFINVKNTSFEIVAEVDSAKGPANGVIVAQGGRFGGWSLFVKDGTPMYVYNYLGLEQFRGRRPRRSSRTERRRVKMDFAYDGDKPGAGGTATLSINGKTVGSGQDRADAIRGLLGRRDGRRRHRRRDAGHGRLHPRDQQVHGQDQQGDHHVEVSPATPGRPASGRPGPPARRPRPWPVPP